MSFSLKLLPSVMRNGSENRTARLISSLDFILWVRGPELLPAAAESFVKLNDRQQLVASSLCQAPFRLEKFAVGIKRFKKVRNAAIVPHIGKPGPILKSSNQDLSLLTHFFDFSIGDQCIRYLAKGILDGLLVIDQQKFLFRLRKADGRLYSSGGENRLRELGPDTPDQTRRTY